MKGSELFKRSAAVLLMVLALTFLPTNGIQHALAVTTPSDITTGSDLPPSNPLPPTEVEEGELVIVGDSIMRGGAQQLFSVTMDGKTVKNELLDWSVYPADSSLCSIKNGKLTTKKVTYVHYVQVTAVLKSDSSRVVTMVLTIVPATKKVDVTAPNTYVDLNGTAKVQLTATCTPDDAMQQVKWSSSNESIATVDENGVVTGKKIGKVTITATATDGSGVKGKITLQVVNGVSSLTIEGADTVAEGRSITLKTIAMPEGATVKSVKWSLDCDSSVATITAAGKLTAKKKVGVAVVTVTATSVQNPEITATHTVTIRPSVSSMKITAPQTFIDVLSPTLQLTVNCYPEEASQKVTWSSSSTKIATVDENGLVTGLKRGTVTITAKATDGSGKTAKITLKVVDAVTGLTIQGAKNVGQGCTITLKATIAPEDATNKNVIWSLDCDKNIATIDQQGRLKAGKNLDSDAVTVVVTAKSAENAAIVATHAVTIRPKATKVTVTADDTVIDLDSVDRQLQLKALVTPETATQGVTWSSSNTSIATIDENGLVTAKKGGTVTFTATATDGSGVKGKFSVQVCKTAKSIVLSGVTHLSGGQGGSISATVLPQDAANRKVTWSVNCPTSVATISNKGYLTTKQVSEMTTITVTATSMENAAVKASWQVTIYPRTTSVKIAGASSWLDVGASMKLSATIAPATAMKTVRWTSSNTAVATVDANGLVKGIKAGTATITCRATDGSGKSATVSVTVGIPATKVTINGNVVMQAGKSQQLRTVIEPSNATSKRVLWSISCGPEVATIRNGTVRVATGATTQVVTVTATVDDGSRATTTFRIFIQGKKPAEK